jgi:hypothetical protein
LDENEGKLVAITLTDGSSIFKRVGPKLPGAMAPLRQFESIGGLGASEVIATEAVDGQFDFTSVLSPEFALPGYSLLKLNSSPGSKLIIIFFRLLSRPTFFNPLEDFQAAFNEPCGTPPESPGKPPFRSRGRTAGGRREALTMTHIACGSPPARRIARAISMSHYQRSLV